MASLFSWIWGDSAASDSSATTSVGKKSGNSMFSFGSSFAYKNHETRQATSYDHLFKLVTIGASGVGKSSMLMRFTNDRFACEYKSTIGADFMSRQLRIGDHIVRLQTWDTSGQERFQSISRCYYRGANGLFAVFDLSNPSSLHDALQFVEEARHSMPAEAVVLLVGQKKDLPRKVKKRDAIEAALSIGASYVETSAKTGEGVHEAFLHITELIGNAQGIDLRTEGNEVEMDIMRDPMAMEGDEVEEFDEEEIQESLSSLAKKRPSRSSSSHSNGPSKKSKVGRRAKTDVNVFSLSLAQLAEPVPIATGDPVMCVACGSLLSSHCELFDPREKHTPATNSSTTASSSTASSTCCAALEKAPFIHPKLEAIERMMREQVSLGDEEDEEDTLVWRCCFCAEVNVSVGVHREEVPQEENVEYLLRAAPPLESVASAKSVVFCIDTSGSMCVSTAVPQRVKLRGMERYERERAALRRCIDVEGDQHLRGEHAGSQHVTRLQCVQAAVHEQIEKLSCEAPNTRVSLVLFGDSVEVVGDGECDGVVVTGDRLHDFDWLCEKGAELRPTKPVHELKEMLLERLWGVEEKGTTALGPAALLSICMASTAGSSVVICTDGLANTGIGSLEGENQSCSLFYTELAEQAKLRGVSVNVVSMKGEECCLEQLSVVSEGSGGTVRRMDPLRIAQKGFGALLEGEVLAWSAMALVVLHPSLQFSGAEYGEEHAARHWLVKDLGNVRDTTRLSFSYCFRPHDDERVRRFLANRSALPFQVQLLFTRGDGAQCLRVCSTAIAMTSDRTEAERHANVEVVANHAAAQATSLAKHGAYVEAQLEARSAQRFLQRVEADGTKLNAWSSKLDAVDVIARKGAKGRGGRKETLKEQREAVNARDDVHAVVLSTNTKVSRFW